MGPFNSSGRLFDKATQSFLGSPTSALYLAVLRIFVPLYCLLTDVGGNAAEISTLPFKVLIPTSFYQYLPEFLLTNIGSYPQLLFKIALVTLMLGLGARVSAAVCLVLGSYLMGFSYNLGYTAHNLNLLPFIFLVLAIAPSADYFSVFRLFGERRIQSVLSYSIPIHFLRVLLIFVYFSAAIQKLRMSGTDFFMSDHVAIKLAQSGITPSIWLSQFGQLIKGAALLSLIIQLLSPLALFWRARYFIVMVIAFQLGTSLLGAHFPLYTMLLVLLWFPWRRVMRFAPIFNETNPKPFYLMGSFYLYTLITLTFIVASITRFEAWPISHFPMYSDTSYIKNGLARYRLKLKFDGAEDVFFHKSEKKYSPFPPRRVHAYFRKLEKTQRTKEVLELLYWDMAKRDQKISGLSLCKEEWLPVTPESVQEEAHCQELVTFLSDHSLK